MDRVDPAGVDLKNLVRAGWGPHTNVGNHRDAVRLGKIKGVVVSLPKHVWKDHGEWYVQFAGARCAGRSMGDRGDRGTTKIHSTSMT